MFGGVGTPELDPGWGRNVAHAYVLDVCSRFFEASKEDAKGAPALTPPSTPGSLHVHATLPEQLDVLDPHVAHPTRHCNGMHTVGMICAKEVVAHSQTRWRSHPCRGS